MDSKMTSKKIMIYSIVALAFVIVLKLLVAISWKLIFLSLLGLVIWFLFDKVLRPKYHEWQKLERF